MYDSPEGEVLPPSPPVSAHGPAPSPAQPRYRDFSVWDPRSAPATYVLVGINLAVFLWMVVHGVSARDPSPEDLLRYGANDTYQVLARGEWYRVVTAIFLHVGFLHLAANMWCLWNLGLLGEPLIGPLGLAAVYAVTGIAGNMLSLAWDVGYALFNHIPIVSSLGAGASGAVFGIAGLLIILLSNRKLPIPWVELRRLRTSVIRFAVLNLIIGGATILPVFGSIVRIDNSAHLGGFLSGLALGVPLVPRMTAGRERYLARQKLVFAVATLLLALFGYWIYRFA